MARTRATTYRASVATSFAIATLVASTLVMPTPGRAQHDHGAHAGQTAAGNSRDGDCKEPVLACATKVTPAFAPDGSLAIAFAAGGRVLVTRSSDLGRTFTAPVAVTPRPVQLDWGPDARPKIAIDAQGRIHVAFAMFKDKAFNGQVFVSRSTDGGGTFSVPLPITDVQESQRFEALAIDADGSIFAAWLDKRPRIEARARGEKYPGAALAFAWLGDGGATIGATTLAKDETCECCRLGVAFAGPGKPVVLFRNIFDKTTRDHAVIAFSDRNTPGPVRRVSVDDWKTDACPHHGPGLAVGRDGALHATWFTSGKARRGLFYARSSDAGETFSEPLALGQSGRQPGHASVVAIDNKVWLAWKEFDGKATSIQVMASSDGGKTWGTPRSAAQTQDASDLPLLIEHDRRPFLSWQTAANGYHVLPLEAAP